MNKIANLKKQLELEEKKESEEKWIAIVKEILEFINKIKHYDFYQSTFSNYPKDTIYISRIMKIKNDKYYLDCQGAYGQWTGKRFIEVLCKTFCIGSKYLSTPCYSTGESGAWLHSDKFQKINTPIDFLEEGKGFPIGIKKSWNKEYNRYLDTGTIDVSNSNFKFGDVSINLKDGADKLKESFYNFKNSIGIITDKSIFTEIEKLYINQCKESYELMQRLNEKGSDIFIKGKNI